MSGTRNHDAKTSERQVNTVDSGAVKKSLIKDTPTTVTMRSTIQGLFLDSTRCLFNTDRFSIYPIPDSTSIPLNGCLPPRKRRV